MPITIKFECDIPKRCGPDPLQALWHRQVHPSWVLVAVINAALRALRLKASCLVCRNKDQDWFGWHNGEKGGDDGWRWHFDNLWSKSAGS